MANEKHDQVMLEVMRRLVAHAISNAATSVGQIIRLSSGYISNNAHDCLQQFHDLYFRKSADLEAKMNAANRSVDALIDQIQFGQDLVDADSTNRLGLTAFQKRLESLIALEEGMREKLTPVLSSMQFEDATRQRLEHIQTGLEKVVAELSSVPDESVDFETVARSIAESLSSASEREIFYQLVLDEDPPKDIQETSIFLDFSI